MLLKLVKHEMHEKRPLFRHVLLRDFFAANV